MAFCWSAAHFVFFLRLRVCDLDIFFCCIFIFGIARQLSLLAYMIESICFVGTLLQFIIEQMK